MSRFHDKPSVCPLCVNPYIHVHNIHIDFAWTISISAIAQHTIHNIDNNGNSVSIYAVGAIDEFVCVCGCVGAGCSIESNRMLLYGIFRASFVDW